MIKFKFGILLCVPEAFKELAGKSKRKRSKSRGSKRSKSKDSKRSKSKGSEGSKSKGSKRSKSRASSRTQTEEPPPKPDYLIEVANPLGYIHVEYNVLPKQSSYSVDIVYWDSVYKIFTADESAAFTSCKRDGKIWIGLVVEHRSQDLEQDELVQLHRHVIQCSASPNKKKVKANAKSEKARAFYALQSEVHLEGFREVYEEDPNAGDVRAPRNGVIRSDKLIFAKMLRVLQAGDYAFKEYVANAPDPQPENYEPEDIFQLVALPKGEANEKKKKKGKKGKKEMKKKKKPKKSKKKAKKKSDLKMSFSGEAFFTDPNLCVHGTKEATEKIHRMYVLTRVKDLMTCKAQTEMNPLVIKLKRVYNLPVEILERERFTSVYLKYDIPNIARATTSERELASGLRINEAHVYFYVDPHRLIEFLQTRRFRVELVGIRKRPEIEPALFDGRRRFNYKEHVEEDEIVVIIAVACFDLSQMLDRVPNLALVNGFRTPFNLQAMDERSLYCNYEYPVCPSINKINLDPKSKFKRYTPLSDQVLVQFGTSLKIDVYIGAPVYGISQMLAMPELFRRLLLVVYKEDVAVVLLNEILSQNQDLTEEVIVCDYAKVQSNAGFNSTSKMVTGFMIDNGNSYIFFIEASMKNYCLEMIWTQIKKLNACVCKTLYSTNYVFTRRIYDKFLSVGGFYKIALKIPLQDIFRIKHIYVETNVPKPCFKALMKLGMLLRTPTIREINQYCMFPTANELMSFDMEFGVPVKIKTVQ